MTQIAYQTVGGVVKLLTKSGGLCTTCCVLSPKVILTVSDICPMDQLTGFPIYNLESEGYWASGVAIGYTHWRVYTLKLDGSDYPPGPPEDMLLYLSDRVWKNQGYYRAGPNMSGLWSYGIFYSGLINSSGMLVGLPQYLCSFGAQYWPGTLSPACFPADIKLCVSPNGTDWPAL
jgi:hypothetical protein